MLKDIGDFETKANPQVSFDTLMLKCGKHIKVYNINRVHDLIQFIGFGKHINRQSNVLFRGQSELYGGAMIPSLYRGITNIVPKQNQFGKRVNSLQKNVSAFSGYSRDVLDPLLQHYGVKTPWIDLVDNIWVALWFALHEAQTKIISGKEYVFYHNSQNEFSYIILMGADADLKSGQNGIYKGKETVLVDLRKASPSFFLRPHAQHAYMIRKVDRKAVDYSDLILGIAKIPTSLGLQWLGKNEFLTMHTLFPPVHFDSGYMTLLKKYPEHKHTNTAKAYGSIQILSD